MSCENCKTGFKWDGQTTGRESKLNDLDTYVTGDSKDTAILVLTDIFGWTISNVRILADQYAQETNSTAYVPDLFDGEVIDPDTLSNPEKAKNFDLNAFGERHRKEVRWPAIKAAAQTLKSQYKKVVAIGFCYGGWACFKLAADPSLIDAISSAHPSLLEEAEIDAVKVPVQILAPERDFMYSEEMKQYTLQALPKTNVQWEYIYFPGLQHGFASRGDPNNPHQRNGLERAKRSFVNFANEFLH
ncbi:hypothetical protein ACN47E_010276 [Coniothyrium glycines]